MPRKLENPTSPDEHHDEEIVVEPSHACTLAQLLAPERVACNITARSKKHCLEIVSRMLTNDQDSLTYSEVFDTIYQREKLGSTGIGKGFALPHGRVTDLSTSVGAFLMLTNPIDFDLQGEDHVDMIFALAVPLESNAEHLNDLSAIATLLSHTDVRAKVSGITSSIELYQAMVDLSAEACEQSNTVD